MQGWFGSALGIIWALRGPIYFGIIQTNSMAGTVVMSSKSNISRENPGYHTQFHRSSIQVEI
jgi:hypothetical protein